MINKLNDLEQKVLTVRRERTNQGLFPITEYELLKELDEFLQSSVERQRTFVSITYACFHANAIFQF